jgi:hypothetical protein
MDFDGIFIALVYLHHHLTRRALATYSNQHGGG